MEIEAHPEQVRMPGELRETLRTALELFSGALAIVTGRSLDSLDRVIDPLLLPAAAEHGVQFRTGPGDHFDERVPELPPEFRDRLREFASTNPGILLEDKQSGLSVHYREAPDLGVEVRRFLGTLAADVETEFRILEGKMVLELRPTDVNKGTAVERLMSTRPFRQRMPVFVGDDITDEHAFETVNSYGGISVRVGKPCETAARYRLENVTAVRLWLADLTRISSGE